MLSACANPQSAIQKDQEQFKKLYPEKIVQFEVNQHPMRFAWNGDASKTPLIFVHGSPGSWEGWSHFLLDEKLLKEFQIISVDRPGYGGSGAGDTERSLAAQAKLVLEVLKYNTSGKPALLVGHSYGGPVIARAAMDHPEKIAGLIFVASSVDPSLEETRWVQYPATWWPIRVLIPNELRVCNEEILALKSELIEMLPLWKNVQAPTIIIQGNDDPLVSPKNSDFLEKNLPAKNLLSSVRVPGLNHFVPWKRPELILNAIDEFAKAEKLK